MARPIPKARLTVVETVYHQLLSGSPEVLSDSRYGTNLHSEEVPYNRPQKIGTDWVKLDLMWVDNPILLVLENLEGSDYQTLPSPEEIAEVEKRIVEVGIRISPTDFASFALVIPGESIRFFPASKNYYVRCQHDTARLKVVAVQGDTDAR